MYLVGPSQVGKTTAAERLVGLGEITHVDLDRLVQEVDSARTLIEAVQDWALVGPVLNDLDAREATRVLVVTLGAGTQDRDREHQDHKLEQWLLGRRERVVLVEGDPDELFARSKSHRGNRSRFDLLELGNARLRIYRTALHVVSFAGVDEDEAARRLSQLVWEIVEGEDR